MSPTTATVALPPSIAARIAEFPGALNAEQAATLFGTSEQMIYKLARSKVIPSFRIGTSLRFDQRALTEWHLKH